jgi:hypothetical protein
MASLETYQPREMLKKSLFTLCLLLALPASAAYDIKEVQLGASERDVKRLLPSAHCKVLEWKSKAADRRCDDSRVSFGGVEVRVTLYLRKDAVEAFDVRFDTKDLDRFVTFLKSRYGAPASEDRDTHQSGGKRVRQVYKARWEKDGVSAVLTAQLEKRGASMLVSRGKFEEEIYRVQ